jgi:hypothetical protein
MQPTLVQEGASTIKGVPPLQLSKCIVARVKTSITIFAATIKIERSVFLGTQNWE